MERVSEFLATMPGALISGNVIRKNVKGANDVIDDALDALVTEGFATRSPGAHGALNHTFVRRFTPFAELIQSQIDGVQPATSPTSPTSPSPRLTSPHGDVETHPADFAVRPPPRRGGGEVAGLPGEDDDDDDEPTSPPLPPPVELKLPGGDEIAALIRACRERGGKPMWIAGDLTDTETGEILARR